MNTVFLKKLLAEMLGTALLLAAIVGSGIMAEQLAGGNTAIALLANTLGTTTMLAVVIFIFMPISGAHFNPAVSLVMLIHGELSRREFILYTIAQIIGACAGVLIAHAMFDLPLIDFSETVRRGPALMLSEAIATFGLIGVILACISQSKKDAIPYTVAIYIASAYWFTASTSFANPAVTIARSLTDSFSGIQPADVAHFILSQLVGAAAAIMVFGWFFPKKSR